MKISAISIVLCFFLLSTFIFGETVEDSSLAMIPARTYRVVFGGMEDLNSVSILGVNIYAFLTDGYYLGVSSRIPHKLEPFAGAIWQTFASFTMTIWPHEFGHWTRAREIGGEFVFEKLTFPWPKARMDLPPDVSLFSETLTSVGGFEINNLMRKNIIDDYYSRGYTFANLAVHAFIQEIYYPAYAFLVAPLVSGGHIDPEDPDTWIHTMGDPVESSLLTYRNYYQQAAPLAEETVDPRLVSYYREARLMSLIWTMLDPGLYEGLRGFMTDMDRNSGLIRPYMFGNNDFSWMFGTMFNASPLGYELYFTNHFLVGGKYINATFRYGQPFDNYGVSVTIPSLYASGRFRLGAEAGYWYQGPFGHGFMGEMDFLFLSSRILGGTLTAGWKSGGYSLGLPIEQGAYIRGVLVFRVDWQ